MAAHTIAVIGIGKISQDQHLPVIAKSDRFRLAALVSQRGVREAGLPTFRTPAQLFEAMPDLDAVAICTPPPARHAIAREALAAGKNVLLEKPPTATLSEFGDLAREAKARGRVIFSTWHSQYNPAVDEARARLAGKRLRSLVVTWKEDVRRWHPGQDWVWQAGGFGVFDPGINALSIVTTILPGPIFVRDAELLVPRNRETPIAASLRFTSPIASSDAQLRADFDWRQTGDQTWTIAIETEEGSSLLLENGGAKLSVDGKAVIDQPMTEYERIYERFADLLDRGESVIDEAPFALVADSFLIGTRRETASFDW
jgi:D-galactose 1-dehydrogenase